MLDNVNEYQRVIKFLHAVRKHVNEGATAGGLLVLLTVATEPGIDQSTVIQRTGLSRSTVSKWMADWSKLTARKKPGPNFVESTIDPMNLVIRMPVLTKQGEIALNKVAADTWGK